MPAAQVLFHFGLGAQVYAKARVKPMTKASLWLGSGVMLEYPIDEAVQLLVRADVLAHRQHCSRFASLARPLRCCRITRGPLC